MTLAHIRNDTLIHTYQDGKGRVTLANGDTVSPPVAGYVNGTDRIVPVVEETVDESTTDQTQTTVTETVEADRLHRVITISDLPFSGRKATATARISAKRDELIDGGMTFQTVHYQTRPGDRENIMGAATAALGAIVNGAQVGDLRWHGGDTDFTWIAEDNSETPMDAHTLYAFGQAAMQHKQSLIFYARSLKDAVNNAQTQQELDSINIKTGWPE